jgi:hypothetical protein
MRDIEEKFYSDTRVVLEREKYSKTKVRKDFYGLVSEILEPEVELRWEESLFRRVGTNRMIPLQRDYVLQEVSATLEFEGERRWDDPEYRAKYCGLK